MIGFLRIFRLLRTLFPWQSFLTLHSLRKTCLEEKSCPDPNVLVGKCRSVVRADLDVQAHYESEMKDIAIVEDIITVVVVVIYLLLISKIQFCRRMSFRKISRIVVDQIDVIDHDFPGTFHIHTTSPKYFQPKVLFKYFFRFIGFILFI